MEKNGKLTKTQKSLKDINKPSPSKVVVSSFSCQNVKLFVHTPSADKELISSASKKSSIKQYKNKSVMNIACSPHRLLTESSSLKPFPKVDPEFYSEKKDFLWQKEITRIKSEKSIFSTNKSINKTLNESSSKNFYESKVFTLPESKTRTLLLKSTKNVEVNLDAPLNVKKKKQFISQRDRDFNVNVSVTNPNKSFKDEIKEVRTKTISPMHLKLYESSLMKNHLSPVVIPNTHPSYVKEPHKSKIPATTKKRIETLKTTYNFMKNYH